LYELFVMGRPRIVKIGASIGHFDRGEEDFWRAVDALRADKPWHSYLYLAVDATGPDLWRLADRIPEEGWQRRGTYTGHTRRRETATRAKLMTP
jgi:hypothetical protein